MGRRLLHARLVGGPRIEMIGAEVTGDTSVTVAWIVLIGTVIGALLIYLRGSLQDRAKQAQDVVDTALEFLSKDNLEQRDRIAELERDSRVLMAAVAHCEREKNRMREDYDQAIYDLQVQVRSLKNQIGA